MPLPKGCNPNAPKRGSIIKVEPIRDLKAIKRIKQTLQDNPSHLCLFVIGINTAFRASDLVSIRIRDIKDNALTLREQKTGKVRTTTLNDATLDVIRDLKSSRTFADDDYLIEGQRGALSVNYVNALVKRWCRDVGLTGNYGSHTLRKTWGYHQRKTFNVELPLLMRAFGHSSQQQTLTYLCIHEQEVQDIYSNTL